MRDAIVVRGGWEGHAPVAATDLFVPFLRAHDFAVTVRDTLDVYADAERMAAADLVVQCWSIGTITDAQASGLTAAVRAGTGFAGWHGGIVGSFFHEAYLHLTGGVFVHHPDGFVDHTLTVCAAHPIVAGVTTVPLRTEKYWVLTDPLNEVLATVTFDPSARTPWRRPVTLPAVWTRRWGAGRVFVSTVGHRLDDLEEPRIRTLTGRGLLWAARTRGRLRGMSDLDDARTAAATHTAASRDIEAFLRRLPEVPEPEHIAEYAALLAREEEIRAERLEAVAAYGLDAPSVEEP